MLMPVRGGNGENVNKSRPSKRIMKLKEKREVLRLESLRKIFDFKLIQIERMKK